MEVSQSVLMLNAFVGYMTLVSADDPCNTMNLINEYKRSVSFEEDLPHICDNMLQPGWYRIISGAGERMPSECIESGYRCNTVSPIWLSSDNVQAGEDLFPKEGMIVNRTVYASDLYSCKSHFYNIQIKGCSGFLVYNLVPTSGCVSAYCFGTELPCPDGQSSETGFSPGCGVSTNYTRKPFVTSELTEVRGKLQSINYILSNITFTCRADDIDNLYRYNVKWYIGELELKGAMQRNLSKEFIVNGGAKLHQEHWTSRFRPSFIVKCSLSVLGNGFSVPGPENLSEPFFAGIETKQTEYIVTETNTIHIPVRLTIPVPCGWPVSVEHKEEQKQRFKDQCHLNLLNGIPRYQQDTSLCKNGISTEGLTFDNQLCGIAFAHSTWNKTSYIEVTGAADNVMSLKDRIVFLRLYNNPNNSLPNEHFVYMFTGITMPDIKVTIQDKDSFTRGAACRAVNDPHMYTFDNPDTNWELQRKYGEGEYVMYKHKRLPLQINAYFRKCNNNALCNCGLAVRSGYSLFVANFCETVYKSKRRVNRYIVEQLCDEESLVVVETGNKIEITIPTGTKVVFTHGQIYHFYGLNTISIHPSSLDLEQTRGLCGIYNNNPNDDYTPRDEIAPMDVDTFVNSWKVTEDNKDKLSLFNPTGELPEIEYNVQQYCTCKVNDTTYPYENPFFSCNLTSAMQLCRDTRTTTSVIRTSCTASAYNSGRFKRSIHDNEEDNFPNFPLSTDHSESTNETIEWKNGWTEESARQFCTQEIENSPSYGPCMQHVPYLNSGTFITTCILDIKLQGGSEWIQSTLEAFNGNCLMEARKSENLTSTTTTSTAGKTMTIFELIEEASCPNNCSGNGICVKGECNCRDDFFGYNCALDKSTPPGVVQDAFDGECDTTMRPCRKFTIPGNNFMNGSLVCNFTSYLMVNNGTGTTLELDESFLHPGIYKSSFMMYCELPPSRQKRSVNTNSPATVYTVTISNNGMDFTEELTIMVFDSSCYSCNTSSLSCEILDSCKDKPIEKTDEQLNMLVLGSFFGVLVAVVLIVGLLCFRKNICSKKMSSNVSDSAISLKHNMNNG